MQQPEPEVRGQLESKVETQFVPHVMVSTATPNNATPKSGSSTPSSSKPQRQNCEPPNGNDMVFQVQNYIHPVEINDRVRSGNP